MKSLKVTPKLYYSIGLHSEKCFKFRATESLRRTDGGVKTRDQAELTCAVFTHARFYYKGGMRARESSTSGKGVLGIWARLD